VFIFIRGITVDPIILFLLTGFVSMSAALSASALNKVPKDQRQGFFATNNGAISVVMMGNLAAITLLVSMSYGFKNLHWAIPLSCMFISFPMIHILVIQRMAGDKWSFLAMIVPTIVSASLLYVYW
jgi:cobalamin synthase